MEITKEQVVKALDLIEEYKNQCFKSISKIDIESDTRSILILGLKTRELNCLNASGINTIGELLNINRFDLRRFRNLGGKGITLINKALKDEGINTEEFLTKHN